MEGYPPEEIGWIHHSSHLHALQLIPSDHTHPQTRCCQLRAATGRPDPVYGCRPCNFYIHKTCAELPAYLRHPSHPSHTLTLVPTPPYLQGTVQCDACWKQVNGFSYHCTNCTFDLHAHCAFLPPTIEQPSTHPHLLYLSFSSGISTYDCDVSIYDCDISIYDDCDFCGRKIAATAWFYYCEPCDFLAHNDCIDQARRGCPPSGAAEPWPVDGQPTAAAFGRPLNPLSGPTPANSHGQAMGAPGLSSGLEPNRGNRFEELKIAYNSLNDKHGEGVGNFGIADVVEELKNTAADINAVQLATLHCKLQIDTVSSICNMMYNTRI